jgi:4-hydroxy-tetrahydrodipicolinate synthase
MRKKTEPRFRGVIPPLVTPLSDRDTLDEAGLERLIEHVLAGGVHGLFILGTTGEAPSLSYRLRCELIGRVCELAAGRVPVLVGITDTAFVESVYLANIAADAGADAVVLSTPYYFPAGQTELIGYVERITKELPLPVMLYNMPSLTKVWFEWETLRQLADLENIAGVKDSGGDFEYFKKLLLLKEQRPDWSIMMTRRGHWRKHFRTTGRRNAASAPPA